MDDSRAALITAYNAVRERYNKLRCQHRQLRKNQSCLNCQQKLNARLETENSANRQTWRSPSEANEIHAICDELKQIAEAGQVADSCCAIQSIIPRLENVASRMAESAVFDVQQESLMNSSALDMSSSAGDESFSQQVDADNDVNKTTEDLLPLKTSEVSVDGEHMDRSFPVGSLDLYSYCICCILMFDHTVC